MLKLIVTKYLEGLFFTKNPAEKKIVEPSDKLIAQKELSFNHTILLLQLKLMMGTLTKYILIKNIGTIVQQLEDIEMFFLVKISTKLEKKLSLVNINLLH